MGDSMTNEPGPELDRRIAKLFGWDTYVMSGGVRARRSFEDSRGFDFNASTTWEGMRLVVEEMQRRGWQFGLFHYEAMVSWKWAARFANDKDLFNADSAPHAVCLAAIATLEGQRDA